MEYIKRMKENARVNNLSSAYGFWSGVEAAQHGVHLTALRRGYAVVSFVVVALLAFVFYKIGGR